MNAIICLGNRYEPSDASGPAVHDRLIERGIAGARVVDGGLAGLNLLRFLDGARRVVFVDSVSGWAAPGTVVALDAADVAGGSDGTYDHAAGLPYLLCAAQQIYGDAMPPILVVGLEGPADTAMLDQAADLAVDFISGGCDV